MDLCECRFCKFFRRNEGTSPLIVNACVNYFRERGQFIVEISPSGFVATYSGGDRPSFIFERRVEEGENFVTHAVDAFGEKQPS
jgi:hypothetical protein